MPLEHVKHLRTINFALIALSAGAIILAIATGEPLADKALRELQQISSFVQSQESSGNGPFGSVWLRRRLLSEYGSLKFDPKQPQGGAVRSESGQELDCFGFFSLAFPGSFLNPTSLNSLSATLLESTLSASEPVKTIAQWKELWDGLHASNGQIYWAQEIVFDRAEILVVDHRPEYKRPAQGTVGFGSLLEVVRGARPRKDLKWAWGPCQKKLGMIKTQFIFLRPSASHAQTEYTHAFWLLLFKDPDVSTPRPADSWNMDAYYFLHIPVRVKKFSLDLQALIAREANSDWLPGTFSQSFPGLEQTLGEASEIPFLQAEKILRNFAALEVRSSRRLSFGGFELAGAPIFPATLLLLVATQIYFLIHFTYFLKHHGEENLDFPWIALYPSPIASLIFLFTCIVPACAGLVVLRQFGGIPLLMLAFCNFILSAATSYVFLKWSWPRYKALWRE